MKNNRFLSETEALKRLKNLKSAFQNLIQTEFESKAKNCLTCPVQGSCCIDEHFVNVHITRLEAVAVRETLKNLDEEKQREIFARAGKTVKKYNLQIRNDKDSFQKTFSCPLFEKDAGCLVHQEAKPAPCIQHACYENREDLPPDELQMQNEKSIEHLNAKTYGNNWTWLPLPVWLQKINPYTTEFDENE